MLRRALSSKVVKKIRRVIRVCRIALLTLVILLAAVFLWLNWVGLPKYFQRFLLVPLEQQQVFLQVGRIRLQGFHQLLLEQVELRNSKTHPAIELAIPQAQLTLSITALRRARIEVESLQIRHSTLRFQLSETNSTLDTLTVTNIGVDVNFHPDDRWELARLSGEVLGTHLEIEATLTNASALASSHWTTQPQTTNTSGPTWQQQAQELIQHWSQIQLSERPHIHLKASLNPLDWSSSQLDLKVRVPQANSPWGKSDALYIESVLKPTQAKGGSELSLILQLDSLHTTWGEIEHLEIKSETTYPGPTNTIAFRSGWNLRAQEIRTPWTHLKNPHLTATTLQKGPNLDEFKTDVLLQGDSLTSLGFNSQKPHVKASLSHHHPWALLQHALSTSLPSTNILAFWNHSLPWRGEWQLGLQEADGELGHLQSLVFEGTVAKATNTEPNNLDQWPEAFWSRHIQLSGSGRIEAATFANLEFQEVSFATEWHPPLFTLRSLEAKLKQGSIRTHVTADLHERLITVDGNAAPEVTAWKPLLPADWSSWLSKIRAEKAPELLFHAQVKLPPWDATADQWHLTNLTQITANATLSATNLEYGSFLIPNLKAVAIYTNQTLQFSHVDLLTTQGSLHWSGELNPKTQNFQLKVESRFNPEVLIPLFPAEAEAGIRFVKFHNAPWVDATLLGNLAHPADILAQGVIRATNFIARQESFGDFTTTFTYTNQVILLTNLLCHRGENEVLSAPSVGVNLRINTLYITNGFSTADPYAITRIIGPQTAAAIDRYRFLTPPTVQINGKVPYTDIHGTDLYFSLKGGDFNYWRFHMSKITGDIHWQGDRLWITNVHGPFYGGQLAWQGEFTFFPDDEADYSFLASADDLNLSALLSDIAPSASSIEGTAKATLQITSANSVSINTWKGHGQVEMSDGFLWSIPLFGSLSGIIDNLSPGFGKSRLKSGTATYTIDKATVQTKDMDLRAPAFGLKYRGNVAFDGALDARAELKLLRDAPLLGRTFSLAFWPLSKVFETHVSGTIENPIIESVYFPSFLLAPLRPIQTLKDLLPKSKPPTPP